MIRGALGAIAILVLLACAQHAAASQLVARHEAGAVILKDKQGQCPQTYAEAVITFEPDQRKTGCWGLQGSLVWIFMPMMQPMAVELDDFEVKP